MARSNSWEAQAACAGKTMSWWAGYDPALNAKAIAICKTCPVKRDCLIANMDSPCVVAGFTKYERLMKLWQRIDSVEESNFGT